MSNIFISYARPTAQQAQAVAQALRAMGYGVWRDDELPAHRSYGEVIEERLRTARAVVVLWSAEAVKSQWVRAEAEVARLAGTLVQLRLDAAEPPLPFNQIQCAELLDWSGDAEAPGWRKVLASIAELTGGPAVDERPPARQEPAKNSICVLPFANMSGEAEQEYFSDGVTEDIITDLSKVSALSVVARNTAFQFKGRAVDVPRIARELGVTHVLEGSVRKAGARVRITAQLIDGAAGDHVWAERYDRDLTDIFALQDEISEAIVAALRLRLLPGEKQAIERRGTANVEAYNLYLMARQHHVRSSEGDTLRNQTIARLCRRAVEIDPDYAQPWALLATALTFVVFAEGRGADEALAAAERALTLDGDLAEAHAIKARHLGDQGRTDEAFNEIELALRLDPKSFEVNSAAAGLSFRHRRIEDAIRYYESAMALMEEDLGSPGMLLSCYTAVADGAALRRVAKIALARAEKALAEDPGSGKALAFGVNALAVLGDGERAREWIGRAILIDPQNWSIRYNCACALNARLGDAEAALDLLEAYFVNGTRGRIDHAKVDTDLDSLRGDPRYLAMLAAAEARLTAECG